MDRHLPTSPTGKGRSKLLLLLQAINISTGTFCIKYPFPGISVSLVCSKSVSKISLIFKPLSLFLARYSFIIAGFTRVDKQGII